MKPSAIHIVSDQKSSRPEPDRPQKEQNVREKNHWDDESILLAYKDWIWDELREKFFKNELFKTLSKVEDRLCEGLSHLMNHNEIVKSITGWNWIINTVLKFE